jgi:cysteine synthase
MMMLSTPKSLHDNSILDFTSNHEKRLCHNILETIGHTPVVTLQRLTKDVNTRIALKLEAQLPGGSIKDRVGLHLVEDAEAKGLISPQHTVLVEPTSGNSGIALSMVAAVKGYRLIIAMPESCSMERRAVMRAYGAELHLTPAHLGMKGACEYAHALAAKTPNTYLLDQFGNPANAFIHEQTTGPELWQAIGSQLRAFVASVGTGGTITGVARYLKRQNPAIRIIAVEPEASPVLSGGKAGPHFIQGIGAGFIPKAMDTSLIDEIITVSCEDAMHTSRRLAREEGILSGISTGANVWAALQVAQQMNTKDGIIATIQCSGGERYLSSPLFEPISHECQNLTACNEGLL